MWVYIGSGDVVSWCRLGFSGKPLCHVSLSSYNPETTSDTVSKEELKIVEPLAIGLSLVFGAHWLILDFD